MKSTVDSGTGQSITWIYDAEGQRAQKWVSGGATVVYGHDALGQLAAEYNSVGVTPACTTCYLTDDMIGTVRLVTDQNQNVVARHDYTPYGVEIPNGTAGRNGNFAYNSNVTQGFTGQEADGGTASLHYFHARHMSGVLGGFVQPDPGNAGASVGNPQTWNAYGYVSGNPLGLVDPSGMCAPGEANCYDSIIRLCRWWQIWCWGGGSFGSEGTPEDFDTSGQADLSGYDSNPVTATSPGSSGGGGGSSAPTASSSTASTLPPKNVCVVPPLPGRDANAQIQKMIGEMQNIAYAGETAKATLFTLNFWPRHAWDYKSQYPRGDVQSVTQARIFGNFAFGAVMRASALSYYEAQNAAGVAQIIFHAIGKGAPGQGVPVFQYPYGDQVQDAVDVQRGYDYVKALEQGTCH